MNDFSLASSNIEDLNFCIEKIYKSIGLHLTKEPIKDIDPKNEKYGAYTLYLNQKKVLFRIGKVTNDRPGAFVTIWKRCKNSGYIIPFDFDDAIEYLFVLVKGVSKEKNKQYKGQFFFDKDLLMKKGIFSKNKEGGKLAMRVFPPWSNELAQEFIRHSLNNSIAVKKSQSMSSSAKKTQIWQSNYFVSFTDQDNINFSNVKTLYK